MTRSAMSMPDPATIPPPVPPVLRPWTAPLAIVDRVAALMDRATGRLTSRLGQATWGVLHGLGSHRWRESWETDLDRGWRQYRGSRCTICDIPWEGW